MKKQEYQVEINARGTKAELELAFRQLAETISGIEFEDQVDESEGEEFAYTHPAISAEITPMA